MCCKRVQFAMQQGEPWSFLVIDIPISLHGSIGNQSIGTILEEVRVDRRSYVFFATLRYCVHLVSFPQHSMRAAPQCGALSLSRIIALESAPKAAPHELLQFADIGCGLGVDLIRR